MRFFVLLYMIAGCLTTAVAADGAWRAYERGDRAAVAQLYIQGTYENHVLG